MADTTTIKLECRAPIAEVVVRKTSPDIATVNIKAESCSASVSLGKSKEETWDQIPNNWEDI